ncbi:MAG TPA: peptide chain release factor N(5)-glutamine methyltransferase [Clostridiales bacterium UBA8960]|jgi:release factor glutamine methyltransferase|nr:peptide chain release factor N(5)-glutamine methyltransferase [Clostridiales bacterium UBA8960]
MTLGELLNLIEKRLSEVSPSWKAEARTIICHVLNVETLDLVLSRDKMVTEAQLSQVEEMIRLRIGRYPLQYSLSKQDFYGLEFYVDSNVLIPRPETEILVEFVIGEAKRMHKGQTGRILDIGVGSGAIVVSLAHHLSHFRFVACDIDFGALAVAKRNGEKHGLNERITWIQSDLFANIDRKSTFDIIVSNPPYIPISDLANLEPEVSNHEPHLALFAGEDGLDFYRRIIPEALVFLTDGGLLAFEAGHDQHMAVEALFKEHGYIDVGHFNDLNGIPRFIYGKKHQVEGDIRCLKD